MASFAAPQNHVQPHRKSFASGHHAAFPTFGPNIATTNPRCRAPFLLNTPYSAKYRSTHFNSVPYGFLHGKFPPNHQEIPKPASQRNSTWHDNQVYGGWNRLG